MTSKWLTPAQAGELLGVHRRTVIRWCRSGRLDHLLTPSGRIRVPVAAVRAMLVRAQEPAVTATSRRNASPSPPM